MEASCELLQRCAVERGTHCWSEFLRRYARPLERRVRRALRRAGAPGSREAVAELMQEVYCRLLEDGGEPLRRFRGHSEGEASSYLGQIAVRVVIDVLRGAGAAKRGAAQTGSLAGLAAEAILDERPDPEERLLAVERRRQAIARCCAALGNRIDRRDLRILRWALLDGWTSREISLALRGALAPSGVDSVVSRLRRVLVAGGLDLPRRR